MIDLFLYGYQRDLLPHLRALFPDLEARTQYAAGGYYRASFVRGEIMRQIQFLHDHSIRYIDQQQQREKRVRAFFQNVDVGGLPLKEISVQAGMQPETSTVILKTAASQVWLYLPPEWLRLDALLDGPCARWLCVYEQDGRVCAAQVSSDEREHPPERMTQTREQMRAWLREQGYVLALCLPSPCGKAELYRPWQEVTRGEQP